MKPLSIADYLDHLGRAAGERAPPRESSPFRPRSLPSPHNGESDPRPLFDRAMKPFSRASSPSTRWRMLLATRPSKPTADQTRFRGGASSWTAGRVIASARPATMSCRSSGGCEVEDCFPLIHFET
jgi:hypothetical protein